MPPMPQARGEGNGKRSREGQVWVSYPRMAQVLKWLTLARLAYVAAAFFAHPDWSAVFHHTFVPEVHPDGHFIGLVVAALGTTISPCMLFWQASPEVGFTLLLTSDPKAMEGRANGPLVKVIGWLAAAPIAVAAVGMFLTMKTG